MLHHAWLYVAPCYGLCFLTADSKHPRGKQKEAEPCTDLLKVLTKVWQGQHQNPKTSLPLMAGGEATCRLWEVFSEQLWEMLPARLHLFPPLHPLPLSKSPWKEAMSAKADGQTRTSVMWRG